MFGITFAFLQLTHIYYLFPSLKAFSAQPALYHRAVSAFCFTLFLVEIDVVVRVEACLHLSKGRPLPLVQYSNRALLCRRQNEVSGFIGPKHLQLQLHLIEADVKNEQSYLTYVLSLIHI